MKKLCNEFYGFCDKNTTLPLNYLKKFAYEYMKIYNAERQYKTIKFKSLDPYDDKCNAVYNDKVITLYKKAIYNYMKESFDFKFDFSIYEHLTYYNTYLINLLMHECTHGIQYDKTIQNVENIESYLFQESIYISNNDQALYHKLYNILPTEINAFISSDLDTAQFINMLLDDEDTIYNNKITIESILDKYKLDGKSDFIISPTLLFYEEIDELKKLNRILNKFKLSNYKRMLLGLPLDDYYLSLLFDIKEGNEIKGNLKKYLMNK